MPEERSSLAAEVERSWAANADAWTTAVRSGGIASRRLATDQAVVAAVLDRAPARVLDLGCGEGWLARALSAAGVAVVGTDGAAPLIEAARAAGGGATFLVLTHDELAADPTRAGTGFGVAVANFALFTKDVAPLLRALWQGSALASGAAVIIQTVHPTGVGAPYRDGWRTEDFRGFGDGAHAWRPMPWYFRTLGSWLALLREAGYALVELREPLHPETALPLSLLITAEPA